MADTPRTPESLVRDALVAYYRHQGTDDFLDRAIDRLTTDLLAHTPLHDTLSRGLAAGGLSEAIHERAQGWCVHVNQHRWDCRTEAADLLERAAALAQSPEATDAKETDR